MWIILIIIALFCCFSFILGLLSNAHWEEEEE